jgi:hypothetical protein
MTGKPRAIPGEQDCFQLIWDCYRDKLSIYNEYLESLS